MTTTTTSYTKKMWWLMGITVILKIILSFFIELGNDEVYYYTYALQPDWNHFDHPGMVGWMIRLTSLNLFWVSALSMRLGSILCAGIATWTIFKTGTLLKDESAGYIAAWMYSLSLYTTIIAGLFVLPDSPQLVFYTISIYWMVKWVMHPTQFHIKDWIILGMLIGLATLSKVHGLYLWIGLGGYILFHQIQTLQKRNLYIAVLITVICVLPILFWNIQNHFITYQFHSKRIMHTGLLLDSFLQQILGEFMYQNPFVYISIVLALFRFKKTLNSFSSIKAGYLLLWLSIPLLITFWSVSLYNPTLPHWTGPAYIALFLWAGVYWSGQLAVTKATAWVPTILKYAQGLLLVLILGVLLFIYQFPKQIGSTQLANLGEYNPINDLTGWESFTTAFEKIVQRDKANGSMQKKAVIVIHKWFPGGHLLFYTARPLQMQLVALGKLEDVHKFAWLNTTTKGLQLGDDAYYIVPSNLPVDPAMIYSGYFEKIVKADTIPIRTKGVLLRNFYVYKLKNCKQVPPAILP